MQSKRAHFSRLAYIYNMDQLVKAQNAVSNGQMGLLTIRGVVDGWGV